MTTSKELRFLDELTASLSQSGNDAVLRRINAERMLQLYAEALVDKHKSEPIRFLPDSRVAGHPGADFLLQIDDYDIRLELLDAPDNKPYVNTAILTDIAKLMEENPSTVALVLVWTTEDLPSLAVSSARARYYLQHPDQLGDLPAKVAPLVETLELVLAHQTKEWNIQQGETPRSTAEATDIRELFEQAIGQAIEAERNRSYRYVERKQAAKEFPLKEEQQVIFDVLREALEGVAESDLVPMLMRIGRRGTR